MSDDVGIVRGRVVREVGWGELRRDTTAKVYIYTCSHSIRCATVPRISGDEDASHSPIIQRVKAPTSGTDRRREGHIT